LKVEETYFEGRESYGDGFQSLFTGGNYGKLVVTTRRAT
jgi:NADPH-dependent curcumin reductase CurA